MSQSIFADINPDITSGTQLATYLNDFKAALLSGLSGTSRPSQLAAGGSWIDTTNDPTSWDYKVFTGTVDITIFTLNLSTGTIQISGSDTSFTVTKISADTVGAIVKLVKRRIASSGQDVIGDVIGEVQFVGRGSDSSNPIVGRLKVVANDNMGATAAGAYMVFEAVTKSGTTLAEYMRLVDGKLGLGTTAPDVAMHVVSSTGIKSARLADDASAAKIIARKQRITGTGAIQNADTIAQVDFDSTDDATSEFTAARIEVIATEAHTSTSRGSSLGFYTTPTGTNSRNQKLFLGDISLAKGAFSFEAITYEQQSVATAASITALSAAKAVVHFTGSTATALKGIDATGISKVLLLHNASSAQITLSHEDAGASATNRLKLPLSRSITLAADSAIELFYDTVDSRWRLKSGSSSGSSGPVVSGSTGSPNNISAAGGITASTTDMDTVQFIQGNGGAVIITATPAISAGYSIGQKIILIGQSDDSTVTIPSTATGVVVNGDIVIGLNDMVLCFWDGTNWILKRL